MVATPPARRHDRGLTGLALSLAALCVAAAIGQFWADAARAPASIPGPLDWPYWSSTLTGLCLVVPGAILAVRLPRHPLIWLLILCGASSSAAAFGGAYASVSLLNYGGGLPLTTAAVHVGARWGPFVHLVIPGLLLFFPDGRLPSTRWRAPAVVALVGLGFGILSIQTMPWHIYAQGAPYPHGIQGRSLDALTLPLPDAVWIVTGNTFRVLFLIAVVISVAAFVVRFRNCEPQRRAQLRWMLLAGLINGAFIPIMVLAMNADSSLGNWLAELALPFTHGILALAVLIAVSQYRLYDVDLLLGRMLLYGSVAVAVIGIDIAVFTSVSLVVDNSVAAVAGAGIVAVLYGPLRIRLHRLVTRLLTGRGEPYEVVSALASRLEQSPGPDELLLEVARSIAAAFRSPYVRVELDRADGRTVVAEHGSIRSDVLVLPFTYRGSDIGRLALVPRSGSRLSDDDQRLLADVVRQAAAATRATALTEELQRSREHLVTGVEEERRRLRRDLHDGLGPALAAAALKIEAARNLLVHRVDAADRALVEVRGDLSLVLTDVRRLVHDLRPPALDQFGLAGAVEHHAARFRTSALTVTVRADGDLPSLPAATEVAAYRIVCEALMNVSQHAVATRCSVELVGRGGELELEVADDGCGVPAAALIGVGLVGMRERAEELGGRFSISTRAGGGTRIHAVIPYSPTGGDIVRTP